MNFLIFIAAFLMACDENTVTRVLHRPLAACTIFGAALGNVSAGLAVGAVLELQAAAFDVIRPGNFILPSLAGVLLCAGGADAASAAASAAVFWGAGLILKEICALISTVLLPSARKAAENRREGGLLTAVILTLVINGIVFGLAAMLLASNGADVVTAYENITSSYGWILAGLQAGGILMAAVGIAVLMRNLNVREMPGVYLAGAAAAAVMAGAGLTQAAALLCAMAAFGIATVDYQLRKGADSKPAETKPVKKGGAQWW